jgi:hypothetical protein
MTSQFGKKIDDSDSFKGQGSGSKSGATDELKQAGGIIVLVPVPVKQISLF